MRHRPLAVIRAPPSASTAAASVEENSAGREKKRRILEPLPAFASGVYHEGRGNTMFGKKWIPPHGEIDTFVAVRNAHLWRVAALNIHNQMPPFDIKPGEPLAVPYPPK